MRVVLMGTEVEAAHKLISEVDFIRSEGSFVVAQSSGFFGRLKIQL